MRLVYHKNAFIGIENADPGRNGSLCRQVSVEENEGLRGEGESRRKVRPDSSTNLPSSSISSTRCPPTFGSFSTRYSRMVDQGQPSTPRSVANRRHAP